jgi:hypothetical protein
MARGTIMRSTKSIHLALLAALAVAVPALAAEPPAGTPRQLVETYDSLADAILAAKKTEWNLVHSILSTTYSHAEGAMQEARAKLAAKQDAAAAVERLATLVSQLGNEGDAAVAAVRKRLLEGGHHHNAAGEEQGTYDPGFVIVTRDVKKALLESGKRIAQMAKSPNASALEAEWKQVESQFKSLHPGAR